MTIVPKGMFLLDGKLVRKPRVWPVHGIPGKSWACGYKENLRTVMIASTREAAYKAWAESTTQSLNGWGKL
jgi:hypothetical protein